MTEIKNKIKIIVLFLLILICVWMWPGTISQDDPVKAQSQIMNQWKDRIQMSFPDLTDKSCELIWNYGLQYQINPTLILCWIEVESGFDSLAISNKGAVGWLQLKLSTARQYDSTLSHRDLYLTDVNVEIALKHFTYLMNRYDDDEAMAFTAYNMGEGRLKQILDSGKHPRLRYYHKIKNLFEETEGQV